MIKQKRDAILALLPQHAYIARNDDAALEVEWTTREGRFRLDAAPWDETPSFGKVNTRLHVFNDTSGEYVMLRTEDAGRVREALMLVGGVL